MSGSFYGSMAWRNQQIAGSYKYDGSNRDDQTRRVRFDLLRRFIQQAIDTSPDSFPPAFDPAAAARLLVDAMGG